MPKKLAWKCTAASASAPEIVGACGLVGCRVVRSSRSPPTQRFVLLVEAIICAIRDAKIRRGAEATSFASSLLRLFASNLAQIYDSLYLSRCVTCKTVYTISALW
jgi:hypothetical protein